MHWQCNVVAALPKWFHSVKVVLSLRGVTFAPGFIASDPQDLLSLQEHAKRAPYLGRVGMEPCRRGTGRLQAKTLPDLRSDAFSATLRGVRVARAELPQLPH